MTSAVGETVSNLGRNQKNQPTNKRNSRAKQSNEQGTWAEHWFRERRKETGKQSE